MSATVDAAGLHLVCTECGAQASFPGGFAACDAGWVLYTRPRLKRDDHLCPAHAKRLMRRYERDYERRTGRKLPPLPGGPRR